MDATMTTRAPAPAARPRALASAVRRAVRDRAVWLVAAAAFGVEMAVSGRYGYDRDELYFLAAGRHLSWGYVDQPALTPLLARVDALLTGDTLVGLRALPALGLAALVLLTAAMAGALGAGRGGRTLAALATACCAEYLGAMHELTTTPVDFVGWALVLLAVTRLLTRSDPRWWIAVGGLAGLGMDAKWNIGFLVAALGLGFAVTPAARPLLRSRYVVGGAVLFVTLAAPDVVWQALHGWPNFAVFGHLNQQAWANRALYWPIQAVYTSIALVPLWVGGIGWALRDARLRVVGVAAVAVIVAEFALGGKGYYPGGVYTFCFAAGATALSGRPLRRRAAVYCVAAAVSTVIALPLLPAAALARFPVQKVNYDLGEEIGWPSQVALVARAYDALPGSERPIAAVLAGNYGEAGALDRYGAALGLPPACSGANNYWLWGPPPARDTVAVAINVDPALLRRWFSSVRVAVVYRNDLGVSDDEQGAVIYIASGLRSPWAAAWPSFRDYS
jgi:4-amino-4-deoxy-L-arabinose transferase-like glycosyltransferase